MNKGQEYKKILIVRLDRIGDVLLSTPVIKALRDAYPDSYLSFMVRPYAREIVEGNPGLNSVIIYYKEGREKGFFGNLKFIWRLRKERFDLALILHPTARSHLVTALAGIPERVGYDKKKGFLLTKRIPHTKQFGLKHETEYTLDILKYIGVDAKDKALYMPMKSECEEKVKDILARNGIRDSDDIIVINPGASCPSRRWSAERFAKLADSLVAGRGAKILIISGSMDKVFGDRVASFMTKRHLNLSGKTSIGDIASIFRRARLVISNDSGPVHVACAVGTPVIAIFSRSDRGLSPKRWGPTGKGDIVLHKDVSCEVCLAHNCQRGFKCLEAITVEDVLAAADKILEGRYES